MTTQSTEPVDELTDVPIVIDIDADRALALLREVVDEYGHDYVYRQVAHRLPDGRSKPMCVYADDGRPSCLVGHALHRAGVTVAELDRMLGQIGEDDDELPERVTLTGLAAEVLAEAQMAQDQGITWGDALAQAVARRRERAGAGETA